MLAFTCGLDAHPPYDERSATEVLAVHEGLPEGVPLDDNEAGWRESLAKLAVVEAR
jgi:hypothetical protein